MAEVERRSKGVRFAAGAWAYTADFEALDSPDEGGAPIRIREGRGAYAIVEADLLREHGAEHEGLRGWVRVGAADEDLYPVGAYIGGGFVYTGFAPGRVEDQVGIAVAHARLGGVVRRVAEALGTKSEQAETTVELTYHAQLNASVALQPNLQYVFNPGADPTLENALVGGLRVKFGFSR